MPENQPAITANDAASWDSVPNAYNDPFWIDLAAKAGAEQKLPNGLLEMILHEGERSNVDQVNKATEAATPFQIIPSTARLFYKKYGVHAYDSPEAAAKVAALHLRESLDRNKGDIEAAIREYNGGPDRKQWGEQNAAYYTRVKKGMEAFQAEADAPTPSDQAATPDAQQMVADQVQAAPDAQTEAPSGFTDYLATQVSDFGKGIYEGVTGEQRTTPAVAAAPGLYDIPELQNLDLKTAGKLMGGSLMENYLERADHISEVTGLPYRTDERGNAWFQSRDGKEYVLKPGLEPYDVAATVASGALPVGEAIGGLVKGGKMLLGGQVLPKATGMLAKTGLPALPEVTSAAGKIGSQVAGGGVSAAAEEAAAQKDFNPLDVALGAALPAVVGGAGSVARAVAKTPAAIRRIAEQQPTNGALRLVHQAPETGIPDPMGGSTLQTAAGAAYSPEALQASQSLGLSAPPVSVAAQNEAVRAAAATARAGGNTSAEQSAVRAYGKEVQQAAEPLVNPDFSETSVAVQNRVAAGAERQAAAEAEKKAKLSTGDFAEIENELKTAAAKKVGKAEATAKAASGADVASFDEMLNTQVAAKQKELKRAQEVNYAPINQAMEDAGTQTRYTDLKDALTKLIQKHADKKQTSFAVAKGSAAMQPFSKWLDDLSPMRGDEPLTPTLGAFHDVYKEVTRKVYDNQKLFPNSDDRLIAEMRAVAKAQYDKEAKALGFSKELAAGNKAYKQERLLEAQADDVFGKATERTDIDGALTRKRGAAAGLAAATKAYQAGDPRKLRRLMALAGDKREVAKQVVRQSLGLTTGNAKPDWKRFLNFTNAMQENATLGNRIFEHMTPDDLLTYDRLRKTATAASKASTDITDRLMSGEAGPLIRSSASALGKGDHKPLNELLKTLPKGQWPTVGRAIVGHIVDGSDPTAALKWYDGLTGNSNAKSLLFSQLPKETKAALEDYVQYARKQAAAAPETAAVRKSLAEGELGAQATAAARALEKGDVSGLSNLMAAVPEEYREATAKMVMAAGTGASKGEGGINLTATANFADNLDRNTLSKKELQKHFTKEEWDRFESVAALARRIRQASKEVEYTGRGVISREFYQKAENVIWRTFKQVFSLIKSVKGGAGVPALTDWWARYTQGSQKDAALRAFDKLIASHDFREMAVKYAQGLDDEARAVVRRSVRWEAFFSELKLTSPDAQTRFISTILQRASSAPSER